MIPLLQLSGDDQICRRFGADLDARLSREASSDAIVRELISLITETASRRYVPKLFGQGHSQFQLTRGLLGLSL